MTNKQILEDLMDTFGVIQTFLFCRMESHKYKKLHLESVENGEVDINQAFDYESNWWKEAYIDLDNKIKLQQNELIESNGPESPGDSPDQGLLS
jgi:hypothetical protein